MRVRKALAGAFVALSLMVPNVATAATVSAVGDAFTVKYNYFNTLIADLTWTVTNIVGSTWSFSVLIDNLSSNSPNLNRITSFGFATNPAPTNLTVSTSNWKGTTSGPIAAGYQTFGINACVFNGQNCQGGGNTGVAGGAQRTVNFSFNYSGGSPLTFTSFATRWQSINVNGVTSIVLAPVPLPAAGWMLLAGLGGLAAFRRFRPKAA